MHLCGGNRIRKNNMTADFQNQPESSPEPEVVLLIHGIRTRANWQPMVERVLREIPHIVEVYPIKYGYFDAFRFWCPVLTRTGPIDFVHRQIEIVQTRHPGTRISIVAHSFGTYAISRILRRSGSSCRQNQYVRSSDKRAFHVDRQVRPVFHFGQNFEN